MLASLRPKSFTITFFGSLLDVIQGQSSAVLGSTILFNFSKMPSTVPSRYLFSIVSGMLLRSKHSRLEYCLLLHVCCFRLTNFSLSFVFTSLVINKFDLSCINYYFWIRKFVSDTCQRKIKSTLIIKSKIDDFILV